MTERNDALIQTASGLWIPRQTRVQKNQRASQETQQDWEAHWEAQGQSWRREPEIDQERQQFLRQRLEIEIDEAQNIYPFQDITLKRNDLEWLIQKHKGKSVGHEEHLQGLNLQKAILDYTDCEGLPLEGAHFEDAKLEGANFRHAELKGAHFESAKLKGVNFWGAKLEGAHFRAAELEGVHFELAKLEGAHFGSAMLEGAHFWDAELKGADFRLAKLESVNFWGAKLEGVNFGSAKLEGADFGSAKLEGANFGSAIVVTTQGIGPMVADVTGWDERSLPLREWSAVKLLGDEAEAKKRRDSQRKVKDATTRFEEYFAATRAYRQVATAVEGMGRKEEAEKFAFRAQVMQRKMHWWSIWQRKRAFWQRLGDLWAWVFSGVLALLSGYGYRFGRSFSWYIGILLSFAWLYIHLSQSVPPHSTIPDHLSWLDACILSVSDMVGRGFFRQDVTLSDPYAGWSVLEGMIGVFMDVVLISTLTQRLFKK
jgi:uncharacterized protein YjbI with pentapeptide repeats